MLDYENIRLKYAATSQNKENLSENLPSFSTFNGTDLPLQKQTKSELVADESEGLGSQSEKSMQKPLQERNIETPNYNRFRRTEAVPENATNSGQVGRGSSQLKLKERLSQVK